MKTLRLNKLIDPRFQLYLVGSFLGLTCLALLFQFVIFANTLAHLADLLPNDKEVMLEASSSSLARALAYSLLLAMPATLAVGMLVTHRVAGPLYRFASYLREVREGKVTGPCSIRDGDQLQDLCVEINATTEPLWKKETSTHEIKRQPHRRAS